jgi:AAA+ superfamily predicted ATPase
MTKSNTDFYIQQFTVGYDSRPASWQYIPDGDIWYPHRNDQSLILDLNGFADPEQAGYSLLITVYEGYDEQNPESLPVFTELEDVYLLTDHQRHFSCRLNTYCTLPCPLEKGDSTAYTVTLEWEGQRLGAQVINIINLPHDPLKAIIAQDLTFRVNGTFLDEKQAEAALTLRSAVDYSFTLVVGAYYAYLHIDEELYAEDQELLPAWDFAVGLLKPDEPLQMTFTMEDDNFLNTDELTPYLFLTLGGKVWMKIPVNDIGSEVKESELKKYHVYATKTNDTMSDTTVNRELLAPPSFIQHLEYLDKKKVFDTKRTNKGGTPLSYRHHYVLTGKRGVGKESAARELYNRLREACNLDDFESKDAVSLLDTTSGYSPKLEEYLDYNKSSFVYIYNAEALMLKGAVGSLTGMEILANKLRTMNDNIVVLSGKKGQLTELVNMCEPARELFYLQFDFEDVLPGMMTSIAKEYLYGKGYTTNDEVEEKLLSYLTYAYKLRGANFTNIYYVYKLIDDSIIPNLIHRVVDNKLFTPKKMNQVVPADIPEIEQRDPTVALKRLEMLIGLNEVKRSIFHHTSLVTLNKLRAEKGFYNKMPPMHMVFTGNPGTGKTTIAKYLGEIYRGIGALSLGHLVETDRSKLVGQYLGETEKNTLNAIERASGGVLFIDEAYNLFVEGQDRRDFGHRVIETLLTYLSLEDSDMIVILAGYSNEMNRLLESNPGLKSRFPYIFNFEDYTPDQLMKIGMKVLEKEQYTLTPEAEIALSDYVIEEYNNKDEHFGNGRFITRLLTSHIIPAVSNRLSKLPHGELTNEKLCTIEAGDIPNHNKLLLEASPLDETVLSASLSRLDALIALDNAKQALHNYVAISRLKHKQGVLNLSGGHFSWNFIGNTGTGKSTVAEILGQLLQGLGILKRGHFVALNIEELTETNSMAVLETALKRAANGLLFLDMDSPHYTGKSFDFIRIWIENKIKESKLSVAVVYAETSDGNEVIARNLAKNGINSFNHTVVFNDFDADTLAAIFRHLLFAEYELELSPEASAEMYRYIKGLYDSAKKNYTVNARTMKLLAQTVAQVAQLRMASTGIVSGLVTIEDVTDFEWSSESTGGYRRVGY